MSVQLELWQLITLLLAFFGAVGGFGRVLLTQFDKRLKERFEAQEKARAESQVHWDKRFEGIEQTLKEEAKGWSQVEKDLLKLQAELPVLYVRREDYIRGQSVIEAKLDSLHSELRVIQVKGAQQHG